MSHFVTDLDVRKHLVDTSADKRGTWSLLSPLVFVSDVLGSTVTVPSGFITDFASVPRLPVAYLLAGDCGHAAAVVHDWLYTSHKVGDKPVKRDMADAVFREALQAGGETWRAWLMWAGVRVGGSGPYNAAGQTQPLNVRDQFTEQNLA